MDPLRRQAYLQALGIPAFTRRESGQAESAVVEEVGAAAAAGAAEELAQHPGRPVADSGGAVELAGLDWLSLQERASECRACGLHEGRTQAVFSAGNPQADLMIIGEAPGADEDRLGEPFVGRAGQLLTAMLRAIGLMREQVCITNVVKCRPPGNRNPHLEEIAACRGFLQRQIALVEPRLILALGAVSAHALLDSDEPVGRLRRRTHAYGESAIPLRVSYHPAYLLRRPAEKAKAWEDLQQVAGLLG